MKSPYLIAVMIFLGALVAGCSQGKLIAQKDQQIAALQEEIDELKSDINTQQELNEELEAALADLKEKEQIWIEEKEMLTHITLDGSATFASARAELTLSGKEVVDRIWEVIRNYPDRMILIEGHADDQQIARHYQYKYKSNWELSSARAHAVLHYLQEKYGIDPKRIAAVGYGEYHPVESNATEEGRATNRRVVITIGSQTEISKRVRNLP